MPPVTALGGTKAAERYLGHSTGAALPDPTTVAAGGYYEMLDAATTYGVPHVKGDKLISNGTDYAKKEVPNQKVEDGGTGASEEDGAAANLDYFRKADVADMVGARAPSNGYRLDGDDDDIAFGDNALFEARNGNGDIAYSWGWLGRCRVAGTTEKLWSKDSAAAPNRAYYAEKGADDKFLARLMTDGSNYIEIKSTDVIPTLEYVHILLTYDGSENHSGLKLYINGIVVPVSTVEVGTYTGMPAEAAQLRVGRNGSSYGEIDIVSFVPFKGVLSDAQALRLFRNGNQPDPEHRFAGVEGGFYTSDFSSDSDGFSPIGTTLTANYDSGDPGHTQTLRIESTDGSNDRADRTMTGIKAGRWYRLNLDRKMVSGSTGTYLIQGLPNFETLISTGGWESKEFVFLATQDDPIMQFFVNVSGNATDEMLVDKILITELGATASYQGRNARPSGWGDEGPADLTGVVTGGGRLFDPSPQSKVSFVPTLQFGGGATGMVYATQSGQATIDHEKKLVHLRLRIALTAKGSSTGSAEVHLNTTDFDFKNDPVINTSETFPIDLSSAANLTSAPTGRARIFSDELVLSDHGAAGQAALDDTNFTNTSVISFSGVFEIE